MASLPKKIAVGVGVVAAVGIIAAVAFLRSPTQGRERDSDASAGPRGASTEVAPLPSTTGSASGNTTALATDGAAAAPSPSGSVSAAAVASGAPVDVARVLLEARVVADARDALAAGDPKKALKYLEEYDRIPYASSLRQEATILKIDALSQVGRRTDARALAYSTRDDPAFNDYRARIEGLLTDAGR